MLLLQDQKYISMIIEIMIITFVCSVQCATATRIHLQMIDAYFSRKICANVVVSMQITLNAHSMNKFACLIDTFENNPSKMKIKLCIAKWLFSRACLKFFISYCIKNSSRQFNFMLLVNSFFLLNHN